jgi:hypothetical protein
MKKNSALGVRVASLSTAEYNTRRLALKEKLSVYLYHSNQFQNCVLIVSQGSTNRRNLRWYSLKRNQRNLYSLLLTAGTQNTS